MGIAKPTEKHFDKGSWGWDGSQWRKLAMIWGYSGIWDKDLGGEASGAFYISNSSVIPAGEIWVLQAVSVRDPRTRIEPRGMHHPLKEVRSDPAKRRE
ncbi:unnamed protein product [marine sediment metagenome]|uniref:Uncharacterized protein n=1 Tax=marine sediment metagenome TaxID=412755 RepID=X1B1Q9_9ZZZZ